MFSGCFAGLISFFPAKAVTPSLNEITGRQSFLVAGHLEQTHTKVRELYAHSPAGVRYE